MTRRKQHVPWRAAGTASEQQSSADDVVRETGWVFNNVTGGDLNAQVRRRLVVTPEVRGFVIDYIKKPR